MLLPGLLRVYAYVSCSVHHAWGGRACWDAIPLLVSNMECRFSIYLIVLDMHVYIYIHDSFVIWIHKSINMYINNSSSLFS